MFATESIVNPSHQNWLLFHQSSPNIKTPQPRNPDATFLGIPRELRLEIYSYVFRDVILHIHCHPERIQPGGTLSPSCLTWTPCLQSQSRYPMLCQNPPWHRLGGNGRRCTFNEDPEQKPTNKVALMCTCKSIYKETNAVILQQAVLSIEIPDVIKVAYNLGKLGRHCFTRITLSGRPCTCAPHPRFQGRRNREFKLCPACHSARSDMGALGFSFGPDPMFKLTKLIEWFPNLKAVALQLPLYVGYVCSSYEAHDFQKLCKNSLLYPTFEVAEACVISRSPGLERTYLSTYSCVKDYQGRRRVQQLTTRVHMRSKHTY